MSTDRRIIITGASGFVGLPLCIALQRQGWHITALMRSPTDGPWDESYPFDLAAPAKMTQPIPGGAKAVVHLAGIAHTSGVVAADYERVNTRGTLELAQAALAAGVKRFVFISSSKATDLQSQGEMGDKQEQPTVVDAYGRSKYLAEQGLQRMSEEKGLQLTILRPSLVYGPGVKGNLRQLLKAIDKGWMPPLPDTSGGISMVSVADVADAILSVLVNSITIGGTYRLDDTQEYNPRRIYLETIDCLGRAVPGWSVPLTLLQSVAITADFLRYLGIQLPLNSAVFRRLFANTADHDDALTQACGWRSAETFKSALPGILSRLG